MTSLYVAPAGKGDGTRTNPMSREAATQPWSGRPQPGTIVYLLDGVYPGPVRCDISGTPTAPISYRAAYKARPVFDGNGVTEDSVLRIFGADTRWTGIEVTNSDPNRTNPNPGSTPPGRRPAGIGVWGARTHLAYCHVHGNGNGVGLWTQAVDSLIDGCVIDDNGWTGPDRPHGHGLYVQNETGRKTVRCTAVLRSYDIGVHAYGVQGGVKNVTLDRVVVASSCVVRSVNRAANMVAETNGSIDNLTVKRSVFWQPEGVVGGGVRLGTGIANGKLYFTDNLLACGAQGLSVDNFDAVVTGNTIAGTRSNNPNANATVADWRNPRGIWDTNSYHSPLAGPFTFNGQKGADGGGLLSWADWRRLSGADATSTFSADPLPPLSLVVKFVTRKGGFVIGDPSVLPGTTTDLSGDGLELWKVTA